MDPSRTHKFGKPYYRSNFMPPNTRQTLEDRLHPPGISTSSNSSWTFSNSHCDVPKPRKGRLCGIFLIGAVLVVALSVVAIGGLAYYIGGYSTEKHHVSEYQTKEHVGAKRQFSKKQTETPPKLSSTTSMEVLSTESIQSKGIPEGAILGISETMQQLNKSLKNKKKEEAMTTEETTEVPEYDSVDLVFNNEEQNRPVSATENIEIVPKKSLGVIEDSDKIDEFDDAVKEVNYEVVKNGHARPPYVATTIASVTTTKTTTSPSLIPPKKDYSDEPWRPIIPSYRDNIRIRNPYHEEYQEKVFEHRHGPVEPVMENDGPITFSRESYEQNLRITPKYSGIRDNLKFQNNPSSRISEDIAAKYKDLVKDHRIGISEGIAEVVVTSDDALKAQPPKEVDIITISDLSTLNPMPTFSVVYDMTENVKTVEPEENVSKKTVYPIGVDQIISGISVIESNLETSVGKTTTTPRGTTKATQKTGTTKGTTNVETVKTTPKATTTKVSPVAMETPSTTPKSKEAMDITTTSRLEVRTTKATTVTTSTTPKTEATLKAISNSPTPTATTTTTTDVVSGVQTSNSVTNKTISTQASTTKLQPNGTVTNPFLDDSRSSSSNFNFGIPDLPILKQFHHLDSLLKSFSKPSGENSNQLSKYFVRSDNKNETTVTRFPVRTKQTTVKSYKKDDTIFMEVSTISPEYTTKLKPVTRKSVVIKGEVEVVSGPVRHEPVGSTTEIPKLITLLPVRSNVNMMRPLRPRPKSNINNTITITNGRKSKMSSEFKIKEASVNRTKTAETLYSVPYQHHQFVNDKNGKRWVYYSSFKMGGTPTVENEKLFIVTPEPKTKINELIGEEKVQDFAKNLTDLSLYNTIENLLNLDYRNRDVNMKNSSFKKGEPKNEKLSRNTSEIVDQIVKIVENVAISTGDSPRVILKVNQTMVNKTTAEEGKYDTTASANNTEIGLSTKAISSHYKLNQAGVPILTKVLNKAPAYKREGNATDDKVPKVTPTVLDGSRDCNNNSFKCGNGTCLSPSKRCNRFVDCPDATDEKNCTCAEHLKAQKLHRKLCDGVVDCWDFTDEFNCEWCQEEFLCLNSRMCVKKSQICDGTNDCPLGDDERNCVTVSPSRTEAETFNYHNNGYLMVRKNGLWGKLCIDNFESVSLKSKTGWKISDLGRSVCKALTFKDFDKVERMISVPNEGRSFGTNETEKYYELAYNEVSNDHHSPRDSVLSFHETTCTKKEVVKVTCTDLECGLRPQATNQWSSRHSRIVGGGNAGPGSWPWQAALYKEGEFQCGGTLISENWLISAGHCFYHNQDAYWVARLGTLRTTLLLPSPYEQLRQISKIILHPHYADNGFINDISLLRLRDPVRFTDYVRPICLPKPDTTIVDGTMCTVVGWGQLSEVGWIFPDTLQEVQLPVLSSSECRKRTLFLPLYKITDDMFCAGYERGGRDACLGDSGGPLMCPGAEGKWALFGVTSNGYGCARSNRPGVYTKVSKYLHWIHSQMNLHSESLIPIIENDEKQNPSTSRSFTEIETNSSTEKDQEGDYVIKLISQRLSNVKLSVDSVKGKDKCKGHRCPLGECLPKSKLCNGHIECSDGSDEKDCW